MIGRWPLLALAAVASGLSAPARAADDQPREPLGLEVLFGRGRWSGADPDIRLNLRKASERQQTGDAIATEPRVAA